MLQRKLRFDCGAAGGIAAHAQPAGKVDFQKDVAPIFEKYCTQCHYSGNTKADMEFASREEVMQHKMLTPGKPDQSVIYNITKRGLMPPGEPKVSAPELQLSGAGLSRVGCGPQMSVETARQRHPAAGRREREGRNRQTSTDQAAHSRERSQGPHGQSYKNTIAGTTVAYDMVQIPAGDFTMGAPDSDPYHKKDEQPPHKVHVDGFWMQAHEVTWDEYRLFMFANQAGEIAQKDHVVDGVSRPTRPYVEMSFGMGINGYPAISMTQHAANKYAEWLSAKTGEFYRLPTEAEWEYACRAGTATAFYFGDDAAIGRLRVVFGKQRGQVSEGRDQEAECLGPLRHARQRDGMDARPVCALHGGAAKEPLGEGHAALSAGGARRILERSGGHAGLCRARCIRRVLEAAGSAAAEEHLVPHGRPVAWVPAGTARESSQRRRDVQILEQRS